MRNSYLKKNLADRKHLRINLAPESMGTDKNGYLEDNPESWEIRYRRLFETAKDGILILDFKTGNIIDANPSIMILLDLPLVEISGKKLWEIGLFRNEEESELSMIELKAIGYTHSEDLSILSRNGNTIEVEFISNVYSENKTKLIQCNIRDITERKSIEKALIASENNFRSILENSADAIFVTDENGKYIYTSKAVTEMLGYSEEEMKHKTIKDLAPKNKIREYFNFFREARDTGKLSIEMELIKKDGISVSVDYNSALLPGGRVYTSCRDISSRIKEEFTRKECAHIFKAQNTDYLNLNKENAALSLELKKSINHIQHIKNDLNLAKANVEEAVQLKSAFLSNISHEIRTPVNAIVGFSAFLLEPEMNKEKLNEYVHIINLNARQLLSNISDIIDISKIEVGQFPINSELVTINKLMRNLFVTYRKLVDYKRIRLVYSPESPNDLSQIKTDGSRISQVICNLLNNAIKYTSHGEIEFGYNIKKRFVEFYVKDSGIGITPKEQLSIFQLFRKLEETSNRSDSGNGLGLPVSKALIEKLGGTISVNSEPGKGSMFTFSIPYENEVETIAATSRTSGSKQYNWADKTILIVEDEVYNHAYIEKLLSDTDAKLLNAWDGKLAVELVKTHPEISMVIMDLRMPVMDGYESMQIIKKFRPKLPVIAQTAYAYGHDTKKGLEAGFDNFLIKPIDSNLFKKVINSYLIEN
jgi:PAS domain S-box-containing protein